MEGFQENISIIVILCFSSLFHCVTWYISEFSSEICPAINNLIAINVTAFPFVFFLVISTRNWFFFIFTLVLNIQSFDYEFQPFSLSSDYSFLLFVPAYLLFLSKNLPKHQSPWWKSYAPCSYLESNKTQNLQVICIDKWETKISKNFNMYLCMFWVLTPFKCKEICWDWGQQCCYLKNCHCLETTEMQLFKI